MMINESQIYSPQYHTDFASCFACDVMETISPTYCPISTALKRPAQTFTFSGKERDAESGLNYFGARYYNSDLSIWISVDPMVDKYPNLSPYTYCANNPVRLVDPDGEELCAIENIYSTQRSSDFNLNISSKESFLGGDPPRWWQTVKNACSTVGTGIVNGLEAADKFSQSDIVGRVAGAISQINPLVSLTNAAVTIVSDYDMFGKPVTTSDKITSGISAGFTVASEAGIILKEAKYIPIETGKYITTGYSVLTIGKSENETTDEKQKKN